MESMMAWSDAEVEVLRELRTEPLKAIQAALAARGSARSIPAIRTRRQKLGLVCRGEALSRVLSEKRRKYQSSEAVDEILRRCFAAKYERRGACRTAMKETGWTANAVTRRARELGISHVRDLGHWSDAEEKVVEEMAWQSPETIQAHLKRRFGTRRSLSAIICKRTRLKALRSIDGMDMARLAEALGVAKSTLRSWLDKGKIRAILRFPELQAVNRHVWFFPNAEIRAFILAHLDLLDLGRVEKFWFVDLLTGGGRRG